MGWLLLAVCLSAGVLALGETACILFQCGPYWLRLDDMAFAWLAYLLPAFACVLAFEAARRILPGLRKTCADPAARFRAAFAFASTVGALVLSALVYQDLRIVSRALGMAATLFALITIGWMLFSRMRRFPRPAAVLLLAASPLLLFLTIRWAVDAHGTRECRKAVAPFHGAVNSLCLIVLDTTRADHLSCYGYERATSPNIDRLAAEGLFCANAVSASNWTPPGHICIFTGMYPSQHGNDGEALAPDALLTLTEILRPQGYYTLAMYNNPIAGQQINLTQGFHRDLGLYHNAWVYPAWSRLDWKFVRRDTGARITFRMAARALSWFEKRRVPVFLFLNLLEPHMPYQMRAPYFERFTAGLDPARVPQYAQVRRLCAQHGQVIADSSRFAGWGPESFACFSAAYDSEIAYVDHHLGKFADRLRAAGTLDDILLVVTADHGEFVGERSIRGHPPVMLDPVMRIPLIVRYPPLLAPQRIDEWVSNIDILPTVLGMLEIPYPGDGFLPGRDLRVERNLRGRVLLSEKLWPDSGCYSIWSWPYNLVVNENQGIRERLGEGWLFRIDGEGAGQARDLYADSSRIVTRLQRELHALTAAIRVRPDQEFEMTPQARERMRALGYID
ncbi:MAG: sulfatase [Candidatus Eisenbacteria bacterium]|nr:sulfatase [Candidatus Eisenbacteria bacterium]